MLFNATLFCNEKKGNEHIILENQSITIYCPLDGTFSENVYYKLFDWIYIRWYNKIYFGTRNIILWLTATAFNFFCIFNFDLNAYIDIYFYRVATWESFSYFYI